MYNERESSTPVVDGIDCGPGHDTVKANTYDRIMPELRSRSRAPLVTASG